MKNTEHEVSTQNTLEPYDNVKLYKDIKNAGLIQINRNDEGVIETAYFI